MTDPISDETLAKITAGLAGLPAGPWHYKPYERGGCGLPDSPAAMADADGYTLIDCTWASATRTGHRVYAHIARLDPGTVASIIARLERAEARAEALEEALRPFADQAATFDSVFDGKKAEFVPGGFTPAFNNHTVNDLRRARAALEGGND